MQTDSNCDIKANCYINGMKAAYRKIARYHKRFQELQNKLVKCKKQMTEDGDFKLILKRNHPEIYWAIVKELTGYEHIK